MIRTFLIRCLFFLHPTPGKLMLWGGFMAAILLCILFSWGQLPPFLLSALRTLIYQTSLISSRVGISPLLVPPASQPNANQPLGGTLVATAIVSYIWACCFVENFDTIRTSKTRGKQQKEWQKKFSLK